MKTEARISTGEAAAGEARLGRPKMPKDDLGFEDLAASYNFRNTSSFHEVFARVMVKELAAERDRLEASEGGGGPLRALNIGCGKGIGRNAAYLDAIDDMIDEHWGVEPDASIEPLAMFERFQHATMEGADLPEASFDVAYSSMVVEHLADPDAFVASVARCLKPGGCHFFMTVNGGHYFARAAKWMNRLGVEDAVLRLLRGRQTAEGYHYPVQYLMNHPRHIVALSDRHGFEPPMFAFLENEGPRAYFPGPLRPIYAALQVKRRWIRDPRSLLTMICRMRRR